MGSCKLIWGYTIGKPYGSRYYGTILECDAPKIKTQNSLEYEEHSLNMRFPKNSLNLFLDFLSTTKNREEISKDDIDNFLDFGAFANIDAIDNRNVVLDFINKRRSEINV